MRKALAERVLDVGMDHHLAQEAERESGNHRNGHSRKRGHFVRRLVEKYAPPGFDDKGISMCPHGTREIAAHVEELYWLSVVAGVIPTPHSPIRVLPEIRA